MANEGRQLFLRKDKGLWADSCAFKPMLVDICEVNRWLYGAHVQQGDGESDLLQFAIDGEIKRKELEVQIGYIDCELNIHEPVFRY